MLWTIQDIRRQHLSIVRRLEKRRDRLDRPAPGRVLDQLHRVPQSLGVIARDPRYPPAPGSPVRSPDMATALTGVSRCSSVPGQNLQPSGTGPQHGVAPASSFRIGFVRGPVGMCSQPPRAPASRWSWAAFASGSPPPRCVDDCCYDRRRHLQSSPIRNWTVQCRGPRALVSAPPPACSGPASTAATRKRSCRPDYPEHDVRIGRTRPPRSSRAPSTPRGLPVGNARYPPLRASPGPPVRSPHSARPHRLSIRKRDVASIRNLGLRHLDMPTKGDRVRACRVHHFAVGYRPWFGTGAPVLAIAGVALDTPTSFTSKRDSEEPSGRRGRK